MGLVQAKTQSKSGDQELLQDPMLLLNGSVSRGQELPQLLIAALGLLLLLLDHCRQLLPGLCHYLGKGLVIAEVEKLSPDLLVEGLGLPEA